MGLSALCPGTFDPVTNGHLDIIHRASRCLDGVVVAVLSNPAKEPLFTVDERVAMLKEAVAGWENVEVDSFSGLLVDFARDRGVGIVVKGLRAVTDFDVELQMAQMNSRMASVETFVVPDQGSGALRRRRQGAGARLRAGTPGGEAPLPVAGA